MFEYQTAISELTGLPVSNATLYEGPSAVASAGWLAKLQNGRGRFLVSRGLHPHSREALATTAAGYGTAVEELPLAGGVTEAFEADDDVSRRLPAAAELPRRRRGPRGAGADGQGERRAGGRPGRPADARRAQAARRVRGRHRRRGGAVARQPARLRRAVVRLLRRPPGVHPADAGADRGRDRRRRRQARVRAHAADARAAHPAREGHPQHHDGPDAERAGRGRLSELARAARDRRARRAAAAPHGVRARARWRRSTASSCCTSSRWCASSRCGWRRRSTA